MYSFFESNNPAIQFENLIMAIQQNQKNQILDLLRANPNLATFSDRQNRTVPMYAAESGCDEKTFLFILKNGKEVLDMESKTGETVRSILEKNKNQQFLRVYDEFLNSTLHSWETPYTAQRSEY